MTFGEWIQLNQTTGVRATSIPATPERMLLEEAQVLVSSDVRRAVESADRLDAPAERIVSPLFREADLSARIGLGVRFPPPVWEFLVRGLWRLGVSPTVASRREALGRARQAAQTLATLTAKHGSVAVIGHGVMNALIARQLRRSGWTGPERPGRRYWACARYERNEI